MNAREALNIPGVRVGPLFEMDLDESATIVIYAESGGELRWRFKSDKSNVTTFKTKKSMIKGKLIMNNLNNGLDITV